jgi:hypothetical protein
MQFDELCALVGALRSRVAELEAKEQARTEREATAVAIDGGLPGNLRKPGGRPIGVADRNRLS